MTLLERWRNGGEEEVSRHTIVEGDGEGVMLTKYEVTS